jgi:hypothetical protein
MTTGIPTPADIRQRAIDDYLAGSDPYAVVAARHGVSRASLHAWVNPDGVKKRKPKTWGADELALTGGRWVNVRGVMRWQPFDRFDRNQSPDQMRVKAEEAMFTEDEAREAHRLHANGCREPRTVVGERVYQRRKKRAQYARKRAA